MFSYMQSDSLWVIMKAKEGNVKGISKSLKALFIVRITYMRNQRVGPR